MTATSAAAPSRQIDPLEAFRARCEARAHLYGAGELDLHDAVDVPQDDAVRDGLVASIGQDAVQAIMTEGFRPIRNREWESGRAADAGAVNNDPAPQAELGAR